MTLLKNLFMLYFSYVYREHLSPLSLPQSPVPNQVEDGFQLNKQ